MTRRIAAGVVVLLALPIIAQESEAPPKPGWRFKTRLEIRANYRNSNEEKFQLKFPFPASFLPVGQTAGFEETVNQGTHVELSVVQLKLDAEYGHYFAAHAQVHGLDKYRRNPTSEDKKFDADELYLRLGPKPDMLDRPDGTSLFLQGGKFPHMERQPIRLLESYGLAATSFNRFEDVGFMGGGSIGRNLYWRATATTGNPLFFRDPNALAGDNGIRELLQLNPDPRLKSGFPILYNTETEGYTLRTDHVQFGQGLGYRWQTADASSGYDLILFHYRRSMADREKLSGTFYSGDLQLLKGPPGFNIELPITDRKKEEYGGRFYGEWRDLTFIAQFTKQHVAGLQRQGHEVEAGYKINFSHGPAVGGESLIQSIQPAVRWSGLVNRFRGPSPKNFVAPSVWWPWTKIDYGVRIGFARNIDLTVERAKHNIGAPRKLNVGETLATLRIRI
jgi:hypothetical protein